MTNQKRNALSTAIRKRALDRASMTVDHSKDCLCVAEHYEPQRASRKPDGISVPKIGVDVLDLLLDKVERIDFPAGVNKNDYLIESIDQLLGMAMEQGLEIGMKRDAPIVFNGQFWEWMEWGPFRNFLQAAGIRQGIPRRLVKHYAFVDQLERQFRNDASFSLLNENKTSKINLNNGTLHFTPNGPRMMPFKRSDGLTYKLPYGYDPSATSPLFKKFFDHVLPDKRLQKLIFQYVAYVFLRHLKFALRPISIDGILEISHASFPIWKFLPLKQLDSKETIMDDLDKFCCQNKNCPKHGVRGEKNIHVQAVYGPNKTRLLYCLVCKKKFSERRGTVFFDSRLPEEKVVSILEHVVEGNGMRKTGRLVKVDPDTVSRYTKLAGEHAGQIHDELVEFSPRDEGTPVRRKVGFRSKKGKEL